MICGQGAAPQAATIAHYKSLGLDLIPGTGLLAADRAGRVRRLGAPARDYGTMPLAELMEPALGYAENGYPLVGAHPRHDHDRRRTVPPRMDRPRPPSICRAATRRSPARCSATRRSPRPTAACSPRPRPAAGTAKRGIERPATPGHRGFVAEAIDRFCRTQKVLDASGRRHRGVLTADDMARWQAPVEAPLTYDYRGYTVVKGGPWSQGPVLLQQLALLQGFDLDDLDPVGPDFVHIVTECAKLAYADREAWYGDPDFVDVPMATLLSRRLQRRAPQAGRRARLARSAAGAAPTGASLTCWSAAPTSPPAAGIGEPTVGPVGPASASRRPANSASSPATPAISTSSTAGATWSRRRPAGGWLQSSPVIPELGFCLGTRLQIAWLDERSAASLRPASGRAARCRRPWRSRTASRSWRSAPPAATGRTSGRRAFPAPCASRHEFAGGDRQPLFNTEHFPGSFYPRASRPGSLAVEANLPSATIEQLQQKGHNVEVMPEWSIGRLCAASREDGVIKAAATPRLMQAYAIGR